MILEDVSKIGKLLMIKESFYGMFLSMLNKSLSRDTPTAGVSKCNINYSLEINPDFWDTLDSDNKKIGLLKHELLHICFNHLLERDEYDNHHLYNIAADVEINQYITPEYYPTDTILLPTTFPELNLPLKAGTKEYYNLLKKAYQDETSDTLKGLMSQCEAEGDFHKSWSIFDELSEADKKLIKSQAEYQIKNITESLKGKGNIPAELKSYINSLFEAKPPSYDWKSYFRRFASSSNKTFTKKTRKKPNKRFDENPALKIKFKKKVLIGIDTSGSVSNKDIAELFNEIYHMYKTGISITVAEGDANIHKIYEYKGKTPEYVCGRGGTDMNVFIEYFNKHKQYNSLIILTDGFIGEKTINTFKPMLTVLTSNGAVLEEVKNNKWGNVIKIQK
jgi:predicted metal-dependent peptidase